MAALTACSEVARYIYIYIYIYIMIPCLSKWIKEEQRQDMLSIVQRLDQIGLLSENSCPYLSDQRMGSTFLLIGK